MPFLRIDIILSLVISYFLLHIGTLGKWCAEYPRYWLVSKSATQMSLSYNVCSLPNISINNLTWMRILTLLMLTHNILWHTMREVSSFKNINLLWVTSKFSLCFFSFHWALPKMDRYGNVSKLPKFWCYFYPNNANFWVV